MASAPRGQAPALLGLDGLLVVKVEEEKEAAYVEVPDPESSRQRFRQFGLDGEASGPQEALAQLRELCHWWLRPDIHTKEQMLELLVLEQFLTLLPRQVQVRVREEQLTRAEEVLGLLEGLDHMLEENGEDGLTWLWGLRVSVGTPRRGRAPWCWAVDPRLV